MPDTIGMKDHVYKILELVGSSEKSIEDAIQNAVTRASKTIRDMKWFEVVQTRGHIDHVSDIVTRHFPLAAGSRNGTLRAQRNALFSKASHAAAGIHHAFRQRGGVFGLLAARCVGTDYVYPSSRHA
jgi:flavin-binding protein dodecin